MNVDVKGNRMCDLQKHSIKPLRVLMFSPSFVPYANPGAMCNAKLVLAMRSRGWHVDVISRVWDFSRTESRDYDYGSHWCEPWTSLRSCTFPIFRSPTRSVRQVLGNIYGVIRTGHVVRGVYIVPQQLRLAFHLHKIYSYDLILSRALPDAAHLPAMIMARKTGLPWIANWCDPVLGRFPKQHGVGYLGASRRWDERFLTSILRQVSAVTFPCARLRDYTVQQIPALKLDRCEVIPHVVLERHLCPSENNGRNAEFTLCHAGNLRSTTNVGILALLRAVAKLSRQSNSGNRIRLQFIGILDPAILQAVADMGLTSQVEMMGKLSYLDALRYLSESDVQVVIEAPYLEGVLLLAKFVDYTQTGRPILAISPQKGTLNDILSQHGGGIAADNENDESVYQALATLYECWEKNRLQEIYGSKCLYDLFSPDRIVAQYASLYERILTKREFVQE